MNCHNWETKGQKWPPHNPIKYSSEYKNFELCLVFVDQHMNIYYMYTLCNYTSPYSHPSGIYVYVYLFDLNTASNNYIMSRSNHRL